jgi:hypothetical protein
VKSAPGPRHVGIKATDTSWCPKCHETTLGRYCSWCDTHTEKYHPKHEDRRARVYSLLRRTGLSHAFTLQLVHEVVGL